MGFSIADLMKACLLFINALAVLNDKRFLSRYGLGSDAAGLNAFDAGNADSVRNQIRTLLASVRLLLRGPLVIVNFVAIVFALVFG